MSMRSSVAFLLSAALAAAQGIDPRSTLHITFPEDSPVTVVGADWGESNATARGGAMLLDLHTSLSLRNASNRRVRGVTLLVMAQEVTPGGKASVSVPSLNVGPGETFPIRIDLRLLRPLQTGNGPLVEVGLDGVLFDDLTFFGPNRLNSRRSMTVWELEARRDRRYFKSLLETAGGSALQKELLASLERQAARGRMDARVTFAGRATNAAGERRAELAFLDAPGAPVERLAGIVRIREDEARGPSMVVRNRSDKPIGAMEIGWIVKDIRGREYVTGAIPVPVELGPRQRTNVVQDVSLRFAQPSGQAIQISEITGFISSVEFADGAMWVPDRSAKSPTPSPEEQRLAEMYRKKGLQAVTEELNKF